MGLFKSKAQKEQERRVLVKQSMRELKKHIGKLEEKQAKYVQTIRWAQKENLPNQAQLAAQGLKMTVAERKRTMEMLLNAEIISQMRDTSEMTKEFLKAVHNISKSIASSTSMDVNKISAELQSAIDKVEEQTENLSDMLENAQDDVGTYAENFSAESVSDEEINELIYGTGAGASSTPALDEELLALKKELNK